MYVYVYIVQYTYVEKYVVHYSTVKRQDCSS